MKIYVLELLVLNNSKINKKEFKKSNLYNKISLGHQKI